MRHSLLVTRYNSALSVALMIVTAVNSPAWAQLHDEVINRSLVPESSSEPTSEESTPPFSGPILERSKLSGDWHGHRTCLQDCGITFDLISTQFYQGVATGGLQQAFQYGGRHDYFLNLDTEKLGLWNGVSVTLHGETRYGESVNSIAGTLLAPNLLLGLPLPSGSVQFWSGSQRYWNSPSLKCGFSMKANKFPNGSLI